MQTIDLAEKLDRVDSHWSPRIVAELNGQHVKIAKLLGEFDWHKHPAEDELFYVVRGRLALRILEADGEIRTVPLEEGQLCVVPRGVLHQPVAEEECHVMLFEPVGTVNTGDRRTERTVDDPERI